MQLVLQIEPIDFQQNIDNGPVYQTAISDFQNFKDLKNRKINNNKYFQKSDTLPVYIKIGINTYEGTLTGAYV